MDTKLAPGSIVTDPEMEAAYFGIPVCYLGEDGEMVALGHHEPRRVLAAFNRHARVYCGLVNVADDRSAIAADWLEDLRQDWHIFTTPNPDEGDDPSYVWMSQPATEGAPNAQPVTYLPAN